MTLKYAFISRHAPTPAQIEIAARDGIELVHVGDRDAFTVTREEFEGEYDGAVVVHPAAALRLVSFGFAVAVFRNTNRAPKGQPPQFETDGWVRFHIAGVERVCEQC